MRRGSNHIVFHKPKRGFTLIELLVVISIIALLLSILMPSLARVKKQARSVVCKAHLKQISLAWRMYCDENEDKVPLEDYSTLGSPDYGITWTGRLNPYIDTSTITEKSEGGEGTNAVLWCPSAKKTGEMMKMLEDKYPDDYWGWQTTYMANHFAAAYLEEEYRQSETLGVAKKWIKHRRPTETMIFCDGVWRANYLTLLISGRNGEDMLTATDYYCRHSGKMNAVFIDGHIDSFEKKIMWDKDVTVAIKLPWYDTDRTPWRSDK
jgi:prepilin-type N-terminal cleavage/methylation domain-containing protein/prepilin-type processing-associated H-X9-DG protein